MKSAINRLYYSITDVAKLIGEEQHVLRYWEREFSQLRPQKNRAGNRVYTEKDLAIVQVIRRLLREQRYTVAGAKEYLKSHGVQEEIEKFDTGLAGQSVHESDEVKKKRASMNRNRVVEAISSELRDIAKDIRQRTLA